MCFDVTRKNNSPIIPGFNNPPFDLIRKKKTRGNQSHSERRTTSIVFLNKRNISMMKNTIKIK